MTFEERIAKLSREFPTEVYEPDELAIIVIKSHLLAEHYLDVILELLAYDPQPLDLDGNTNFAVKVKLVCAFTQFGGDPRWAVVNKLNKVRNMVAHRFKGPDRDEALKKLRTEVIRITSRNPNASDNPEYELEVAVQAAGTFCVSLFVDILQSLTRDSLSKELRMVDSVKQVRRCRELSDHLRATCLSLTRRFDLLNASYEPKIAKDYLDTPRIIGFQTIQEFLLETGVQEALALVRERSVSLATLVDIFRDENRRRFSDCIKLLEDGYVHRQVKSARQAPLQEGQQPEQNPVNEPESAARKAFWLAIDAILSHWNALTDKTDSFVARVQQWVRFTNLAKQGVKEFESKASEMKLDTRLEIQPIISTASNLVLQVSELVGTLEANAPQPIESSETDALLFWDYTNGSENCAQASS